MKTLIPFIILLGSACLSAEDLRINHETYLKTSTAQASSLPDNQKCRLDEGALIAVSSFATSGNHYQVTMSNESANCKLNSGYLYSSHIDRQSKLITAHLATVFKKQAISSSQLPESDKCSMPVGIYTSTDSVTTATSGHYAVHLREGLSGCGFSTGYIFEGHSQPGVMALQVTVNTVFKKQPEQSSSLPAADKCALASGTYILAAPAQSASGGHYQTTLAEGLAGCSFSSGYIYYDHTQLADPSTASTPFTFPMPGGVLGSAWCVCRSVGTSPHIGQDIFTLSGPMRAVAVKGGVVENTSFSSTCGYISHVRDQFGTRWRYVHLNNPAVGDGNAIAEGQTLANISSFPLSGCGTGPHLHFERRSAGYFGDAVIGKSCQNGYRSCYYDPIKPWRSGAATSTASPSAKRVELNWGTSATLNAQSCKILPAQYPQVGAEILSQTTLTPKSALHHTLERIIRNEDLDILSGSLALADNLNNHCKRRACLVSWQVLAEQNDGTVRQLFFENRLRNRLPVRDQREQYCVPANTKTLWVVTKDNRGKRYRQIVK